MLTGRSSSSEALRGVGRYLSAGDSTGVRRHLPTARFLTVLTVFGLAFIVTTSGQAWAEEGNEPPSFASNSVSRSVAENESAGARVGGPVTASDPGDVITYSIIGSNPAGFTIVGSSGLIQTGQELDYEGTASYRITVQAKDVEAATDTIEVIITVTDANDPPVFPSEGAVLAVEENSLAGTSVGQSAVTATDQDGDGITYSLSGDSAFEVAPNSGVIRVAAGASLNYEGKPRYRLTLTANDGNGGKDSIAVTVTLNDLNEPPAFAESVVALSVAEDVGVGGDVGSPVTATDPDGGDSLTYSLTGQNEGGFTIVAATGQVRVGQELDYEGTASYRITVQAKDVEAATDTIAVIITVTDANDPPVFPSEGAVLAVDENSLAGTSVGQSAVTATDQDGDGITYSLSGDSAFEVAPSSGVIRIAAGASLNYEGKPRYRLTLTANDGNGGKDSIAVTVTLNDLNEPPAFAESVVALSVAEDVGAGGDAGSPVTATDPDGGGSLTYSLTGQNEGGFTIVAATGQVRVGQALDYETAVSHSLTVQATDSGGLTATKTVTVNVTDVIEYSVAGVSIGAVTASSAEATVSLSNPDNEEGTVYLRYRTPPDSGAWTETTAAISGNSLQVALTGLLDASNYRLQAAAARNSYSDAETVSFRTRRAALSLSISFSPAADVPLNTEITVDVAFAEVRAQTNSGLTFRVDFAGGDACEGSGMGSVQSLANVDEDPEVRTVTVTDGCHAGFHTLQLRVYDGGNLWVAQDFSFTVRSPQATPLPTPIPDVRREASGAYGYLATVHLVVSPGSGGYGYAANDYGGLTAGRLPGVLFADGRERPVGEISVSSSGQLKIAYSEAEAGHFKDAESLQWLRVQLRAADNSTIGGADLWDSSACDGQSICADLGASLAAHDGQPVGVDFFDAVAETLDSAPGGMKNILIVAADTGSDGTGVDQANGEWIGGGFPNRWFKDGFDKPVETLIVWHGGSNRRIELGYDSAQTTGQWKTEPAAYRKYKIVLRDREGEEVLAWPMREALEAMSEDSRRCGDSSPARRLCLAYNDSDLDLDLTEYRGQVLLLQIEDITWYAMLAETPGGPVGGQLALAVFGACMFGWTFRKSRSPQREWIILTAGAVSSCLLPIFGYGDIFWAGAIVIIAILAGSGWFFVTRSR